MCELSLENKEIYFENEVEILDSLTLMDSIEDLEKRITERIEQSDGVYVFRSQMHEPEDNDFISWLRKQKPMRYYKNLTVHYRSYNKKELLMPRGNDGVFYHEFTDQSKRAFLRQFRVSIFDIRNTLSDKILADLEDSHFYTSDPLYDQFDFLFTNGSRILLETRIHIFNFLLG